MSCMYVLVIRTKYWENFKLPLQATPAAAVVVVVVVVLVAAAQ